MKTNQATPKDKSQGIKYRWQAKGAKDATFIVYEANNPTKGKFVAFRMLDNGKMANFTATWHPTLKEALRSMDEQIKRWEKSDRRFNKYDQREEELFQLIQTKPGVNKVVKMLKQKNSTMSNKHAERLARDWKTLRKDREAMNKIFSYIL